MLPQIKKRKIGRIKIIDIQGDLTGPWAVKARQELHALVKNEEDGTFVINLKGIQGIDSLGVKAIAESLPPNRKVTFLNGNLSVMDMFEASSFPAIRVIQSEEELVQCFGSDLVSFDDDLSDEEKRQHMRLTTALPVIFTCIDPGGNEVKFGAIATNLSEAGVFAEYINLEDAVKSQNFVNPYELKLLTLKIKLPNFDLIVKGKVVRRKLDGDQVGIGIEFYQIGEKDRAKIKDFLETNTESFK